MSGPYAWAPCTPTRGSGWWRLLAQLPYTTGCPLTSVMAAQLAVNIQARNDWWSLGEAVAIINALTAPYAAGGVFGAFGPSSRVVPATVANVASSIYADAAPFPGNDHYRVYWFVTYHPDVPHYHAWCMMPHDGLLYDAAADTQYSYPIAATDVVVPAEWCRMSAWYATIFGTPSCPPLSEMTLGAPCPSPISYTPASD